MNEASGSSVTDCDFPSVNSSKADNNKIDKST